MSKEKNYSKRLSAFLPNILFFEKYIYFEIFINSDNNITSAKVGKIPH
jgi:hypothetical protein